MIYFDYVNERNGREMHVTKHLQITMVRDLLATVGFFSLTQFTRV